MNERDKLINMVLTDGVPQNSFQVCNMIYCLQYHIMCCTAVIP